MTRLEFGTPQTADQALFRLPTRRHPLYSQDEVFEHATHFGERLVELHVLSKLDPDNFQGLDLEQRLIPLTSADILFIEKISFRRKHPVVAEAQWEFIRQENEWSLFLPAGDDAYKHWEVCEFTPDLEIEGLKLISVEFNPQFCPDVVYRHMDKHSEFEVGILKQKEIDSLVGEITRWNR